MTIEKLKEQTRGEIMNNTYITDNPYITITEHDDHYYTLESDCGICKGYVKKLDDNKSEFRLDSSFYNSTGKYRSKRDKMFKSDAQWFCYMIEKYAHNFGQ